jgi:hypothetical protein
MVAGVIPFLDRRARDMGHAGAVDYAQGRRVAYNRVVKN